MSKDISIEDLDIDYTLTPAEEKRLLEWLGSSTYGRIRQRLLQTYPRGFESLLCVAAFERLLGARAEDAQPDYDYNYDYDYEDALELKRQGVFLAAVSLNVPTQELMHLCSILFRLERHTLHEPKGNTASEACPQARQNECEMSGLASPAPTPGKDRHDSTPESEKSEKCDGISHISHLEILQKCPISHISHISHHI